MFLQKSIPKLPTLSPKKKKVKTSPASNRSTKSTKSTVFNEFREFIDTSPFISIENDVFHYVNLLREDPLKFHEFLQNYSKFLDEKNIYSVPGSLFKVHTEEGKTGVESAIEFLEKKNFEIKQQGKYYKPFRYSVGLSLSAKELVFKNRSEKKILLKYQKNGKKKRIQMYSDILDDEKNVGEILIFGERKAQKIVLSILIEDGVKNKMGRELLFDDMFEEIGIGLALGNQKHHFGLICGLTFAVKTKTKPKFEKMLTAPTENDEIYADNRNLSFVDMKNLNVFRVTKNKISMWMRKGEDLEREHQFTTSLELEFKLFSPMTTMLFSDRSYDFVFLFRKELEKDAKIEIVNNRRIYEPYVDVVDGKTVYSMRFKSLDLGIVVVIVDGYLVFKSKVE